MSTRFKFSVLLVVLGLMLAFIPEHKNNFFRMSPATLSGLAVAETNIFTVDQVARFINNEDTAIRLIDVRSPEEYKSCSIPGSISIPIGRFTDKNMQGYLDQNKVKNIFYSDGDILSSAAWTIVTGRGYKNNYLMKGGMNEWFRTVMNTEFTGERISAKENALFENRTGARELFTRYNSLPDSIRIKLPGARQAERKKLDGGCE
jgi:rhodanese-related sulfurtransferase